MRKEKILRLALVLLTSIIIMTMSINVFAADGDALDFFEDTTNELDLNTTTPDTNTVPDTNTNVENTTPETNNTNTNLPQAGLVEDTMAGIALTVLAITAVYAYRKVKEYQNI